MRFHIPTPILLDTKAMAQYRVNIHYQTRIAQSFADVFKASLESELNATLWFVTFTFHARQDQPTKGLSSHPHLFRHFERLYTRLLRRLIGSKFNRPTKNHLQPRVLVFLDVDASLKEDLSSPFSSFYPASLSARSWNVGAQVPHLHCIFLLPSEVRERFEELMRDPKAFWRSIAAQTSIAGETHVPLETSDTQQVRKSEVFNTLDYASKFLKKAPGRQDTTDLWMIWPTALSERKPKQNGRPITLKDPCKPINPNVVRLRAPCISTSNTVPQSFIAT